MSDPKPRKKRTWVAKIGLAVCSTFLTYALVRVISRSYAWQIGIRDRQFRYENEINMWRSDPTVGFANQRNFSDYCFGTVQVTTNEHGFRGHQSVSTSKAPGTTRIIGLGDSVMWGTCVDDSESFLGLLSAKLNSNSRKTEVINAGVVGYSTLQEYLLLEKFLLAFSPDVVMINFCENDLLSTEDPYRRVRDVYVSYLYQFVSDPRAPPTNPEQYFIRELISVFESPAPVHLSMARSSNECKQMAMRLLLEIPIRRMAQLAQEGNARLIFLLIPPRDDDMAYMHLAETVKRILDEHQVAYLDLRPSLKGDRPGVGAKTQLNASGDGGIFQDHEPGWLQSLTQRLLPDIRAINLVSHINTIHRDQNYIDFIHPSRKGNEIIAQQILDHLSTIPSPPTVAAE